MCRWELQSIPQRKGDRVEVPFSNIHKDKVDTERKRLEKKDGNPRFKVRKVKNQRLSV